MSPIIIIASGPNGITSFFTRFTGSLRGLGFICSVSNSSSPDTISKPSSPTIGIISPSISGSSSSPTFLPVSFLITGFLVSITGALASINSTFCSGNFSDTPVILRCRNNSKAALAFSPLSISADSLVF